MHHIPVLLDEVLRIFNPQQGQSYIDATLGDGGHATALLKRIAPNGRLLGLDQDKNQIAVAAEALRPFGKQAILCQSRFSSLATVAKEAGFDSVDGCLFDFGISSRQLDDSRYGLHFEDTAPLDMRLGDHAYGSAADFLNRANETEIADVLYSRGDRHNSRLLARKIMTYRRKQLFQVAHDVKVALNLWSPAQLAPIFQALRIWVNQEYEEIEAALPQAIAVLRPGGVLVAISFHSGEDRFVKHFLQEHRALLEVNKKIIIPSLEEIRRNPRSRSAKLRFARKKELSI